MKNGVIQFFNKLQGTPDESDLSFLRVYAKLIGMLLHNVKEINEVINIKINVQNLLDSLKGNTNIYNDFSFGYSSSIDDLETMLKNLDKSMVNMEKYNKAFRMNSVS